MQSAIGSRVGERLKELRLRAGLTQPALGERATMAAAEISKIENGRRTPTLETLERLGLALGLPVRELLAFDQGVEFDEAPELDQIMLRLHGQPPALLHRAAAVIDALVRAG